MAMTPQPISYTDGPTLDELIQSAFESIENENIYHAASHFCDALPIILTTPVSNWNPRTIWVIYAVNYALLSEPDIEAGYVNKNLESIHPLKLLYAEMLFKLLLLATYQLSCATDDELSQIKAFREESDHTSISDQIEMLQERKRVLNSYLS